MNQNTIESIEWHKDQLSKLLSNEDNFYKIEIELDNVLEKAKRGQRTEMRTVRRGGKTFQRKTRVGRKDVSGKVGDSDVKSTPIVEPPSSEKVADTIEMGDLVDFGAYGNLFVVSDLGERYWVTDKKADRFNSDARGWYIEKYNAERILDSPSEDDESEYEMSPEAEDRTKNLEYNLSRMNNELKELKDPDDIKLVLDIIADLENELKEQKVNPRGRY